jgi:F0F1-type ATP synthase assembly protein I
LSSPTPPKPTGSQLAGLGISIAAAFLVPLALGVVFDAFLHTSPFGVFVGLLVGITAACYTAVARLRPYV